MPAGADNKAAIRRYLEADEQGYPDPHAVLAPGFMSHDSSSDHTVGAEEFLGWARSLRDALHPSVTVGDLLCDGDRVAVRVTWTGSQTGAFAGLAPTGRAFRVSGIGIFRVQDGRVAERWLEFDAAGLMRQLSQQAADQPAPTWATADHSEKSRET